MLRCQADFASRNHGMVVKFEDEIRAMASDSQSKRIGFIEDGQLKGYAVYDFVSESEVNYTLNRIEVSELVYLSPAVLRAFLGFFRNQSDLAENIVIRTGEGGFLSYSSKRSGYQRQLHRFRFPPDECFSCRNDVQDSRSGKLYRDLRP